MPLSEKAISEMRCMASKASGAVAERLMPMSLGAAFLSPDPRFLPIFAAIFIVSPDAYTEFRRAMRSNGEKYELASMSLYAEAALSCVAKVSEGLDSLAELS